MSLSFPLYTIILHLTTTNSAVPVHDQFIPNEIFVISLNCVFCDPMHILCIFD